MKRLTLALTLVLFSLSLSAQAPQAGRQASDNRDAHHPSQEERAKQFEEMQARVKAYFVEEIGLSSEEAEIFWTIYSEINLKRMRLNRDLRIALRPVPQEKEASFDYSAQVKKVQEIKQQQIELDQEGNRRLSEVLSPRQMFRFYRAEDNFTRNLLQNSPFNSPRPQGEHRGERPQNEQPRGERPQGR